MVTVSLYKMSSIPEKFDIIFRVDNEKLGECEFNAKQSKYDEDEIQIEVFYEEDLEKGIKRFFSDDASEIASYLKDKGKEKIKRRIFCFLNRKKGVLEIYRGQDYVTYKIKECLERLIGIRLEQINLSYEHLLCIINQKSEEVKQAMFKYIDGLWYQILKGNKLENNKKYLEYVSQRPESLRMISVIPKIDWSNGSKYTVTFNGDSGTINMIDSVYKWKPRQEIRQFVDMMI